MSEAAADRSPPSTPSFPPPGTICVSQLAHRSHRAFLRLSEGDPAASPRPIPETRRRCHQRRYVGPSDRPSGRGVQRAPASTRIALISRNLELSSDIEAPASRRSVAWREAAARLEGSAARRLITSNVPVLARCFGGHGFEASRDQSAMHGRANGFGNIQRNAGRFVVDSGRFAASRLRGRYTQAVG